MGNDVPDAPGDLEINAVSMNRRDFLRSLAAFGLAACSNDSQLPFPELEVAGTAGDLGLTHGKTFARIIRQNLDFYLRWLSLSGRVPRQRLLEHAESFVPVLETHFPRMLEEMDGIASGAGLRLEEVMLINARTDIHALVLAELTGPVPGCTAIALVGQTRGESSLALSQNWDWHTDMVNAPVVLRLRPREQPDLIMLVEAGMVGKIGFNEHRLGVCLNFLSHTSDGRPGDVGVPIHCLLRASMGCSTLEEVEATVKAVPRCASANFLLAQHGPTGPDALDLEISPLAVASLHPEGGVLVHTNHFVDPSLAMGCTSGRQPSTMMRYSTATELAAELQPTVSDPVQRAQLILQSRDNQPFCISRQRIPGIASATLAGIVMDLTHNRFILARGAPHGAQWRDLAGV